MPINGEKDDEVGGTVNLDKFSYDVGDLQIVGPDGKPHPIPQPGGGAKPDDGTGDDEPPKVHVHIHR
jgi:hypothetical protein